jgi:hypothetical protein
LPTVCEFNEEHGVLVTVPPVAGEFLAAIEAAVNWPGTDADVARRREVASLADWELRLETMSRLIEEQIEQRNSAAESIVSVLN